MRILHISDTHSTFKEFNGKFDVILHTGDFFANSSALLTNNRTYEAIFQEEWLNSQLINIKNWLKGYPFLFVLGNHDFINPDKMEQILNSVGIKALSLHEKIVSFENFNYYGFPYVPFINGKWNYELNIPEMQIKVEEMINVLNSTYIDVVAAHAPINGILDVYQNHLGSSVIANGFDYKLNINMMPQVYCHGHIHQSHGVSFRNGMLISNAATFQNLLEI